MDATSYYNERSLSRRSLAEGDGVRNTHNFVKAVLIEQHLKRHSHLLDLGCGQGGDLLKYRRLTLRSYRAIDVSHTAIEATSRRITRIKLRCRVKLECIDFTSHDWTTHTSVDAVSCQFAIQYAFASRPHAEHVLSRISAVLKEDGVFIGVVPLHAEATYTPITVTHPGDARRCLEYSVQKGDLVGLCLTYQLELERWTPFTQFCDAARRSHAQLYASMKASTPDPNNVAFVFRKCSRI